MNYKQMVIKAAARLVSKGLAEYFEKDGKPAIRLTEAGRKLLGDKNELHLLAKEMQDEKEG